MFLKTSEILETTRWSVSLIAKFFSTKKEKMAKTTGRKINSDVVTTEKKPDSFVSEGNAFVKLVT